MYRRKYDLSSARLRWTAERPDVGCVEAIGRESFTLAEAYAFEPRLAALYPGNNHVRPKIRQQLQALRDRGWLEFLARGRYRVRGVG